MSLLTWAVILLLVAVNALYVAAEFSSVSARRSRIRQLADDGNATALKLLPILEDARKLDRYIAACQIGITLSSLVLGAYGQATLAVQLTPFFEKLGGLQNAAAQSLSAVVVLVGLTVFQVILGELVPKSLALQYTTSVALYTVLPMRWSLVLFSWFIRILNGSGIAVLKLLKIPQDGHRHIHSPEEIDILFVESRDGGLLEPDEQQRLHQALRLGLRPVHQLMVPRPIIKAIDVETPIEKILTEVMSSPYSRLPVYKGSLDNIVGVLHAKELALHFIEHGSVKSINQVMKPVLAVPETITADRLLEVFRKDRSQQAIVMDEYGGVEGLVTLEDVLNELLGEVGDEFKEAELSPERLPDGRIRLPGLMSLDDAEEWIGLRWHGMSHTVAGRIMEELGRIPASGDTAFIDGILVEVDHVADHTILTVLVTPASPAGDDYDG